MTRMTVAIVLLLAASPALSAEEGAMRSLAACKSINGGSGATAMADFSEDELKEKLCLSSLSVVRSADPMASMQCRLAFKTLFAEFSRRHPRKEMTEVYGRC